jgi:DNA polymerase-3 subunit epsilon
MGPNSLDALCRRYGIDNSRRDKHGALLDSELLADVYMELIGGRQTVLGLTSESGQAVKKVEVGQTRVSARPAPLASRLSQAEIDAHNEMIAGLGDKALWRSAGNS